MKKNNGLKNKKELVEVSSAKTEFCFNMKATGIYYGYLEERVEITRQLKSIKFQEDKIRISQELLLSNLITGT